MISNCRTTLVCVSLIRIGANIRYLQINIGWIAGLPEEEQVINIFMELSALGIAQPLYSNILQFMKALPACAKEKGISFSTPSEIVTKFKSVDQVDVPYPMSWADEERDTSCWLGNVMQREAFNKLYSVAGRVHLCDDRRIKQDWDYLQAKVTSVYDDQENWNLAQSWYL